MTLNSVTSRITFGLLAMIFINSGIYAGERIIVLQATEPLYSILPVKSMARSQNLARTLQESETINGSSGSVSSGEQLMSVSVSSPAISESALRELLKQQDRDDNWTFAGEEDYEEEEYTLSSGDADLDRLLTNRSENQFSERGNDSGESRDSFLEDEDEDLSLMERFLTSDDNEDSGMKSPFDTSSSSGDKNSGDSDDDIDLGMKLEKQLDAYDRFINGSPLEDEKDATDNLDRILALDDDEDDDSGKNTRNSDDDSDKNQWERLFSKDNSVLSTGMKSRLGGNEPVSSIERLFGDKSSITSDTGFGGSGSVSALESISGNSGGSLRAGSSLSSMRTSLSDSGSNRKPNSIASAVDQSNNIPGSSAFNSESLNSNQQLFGAGNNGNPAGFNIPQGRLNEILGTGSAGMSGGSRPTPAQTAGPNQDTYFRQPTVLKFPKRGF